jgi:hypothetical protein
MQGHQDETKLPKSCPVCGVHNDMPCRGGSFGNPTKHQTNKPPWVSHNASGLMLLLNPQPQLWNLEITCYPDHHRMASSRKLLQYVLLCLYASGNKSSRQWPPKKEPILIFAKCKGIGFGTVKGRDLTTNMRSLKPEDSNSIGLQEQLCCWG